MFAGLLERFEPRRRAAFVTRDQALLHGLSTISEAGTVLDAEVLSKA